MNTWVSTQAGPGRCASLAGCRDCGWVCKPAFRFRHEAEAAAEAHVCPVDDDERRAS